MGQFASQSAVVIWLSFCGLGFGQDTSADKGAAAAPAKPEAILFEPLPVVEAASLHAQTLVEAPASVTVITDEEIRRRGYRTLADALDDVRGMYISYDRAYRFVGVRGFSLPGDYNTRFLMMVNGHSLTENVYGSAGYFGEDFGLDMELIKRIEIIRGPSSALYGSNGMFATINIVTKSPVEYERFRVTTGTGTFGERKVHVSASQYLGRGANLLLSASVFNNAGQDLYFPAFDTPQSNHGWAVGMDGEKGYHTFANLIWRDWSFLAYFNDREKLVPTAWYGTTFNGRGTKVEDGRGFVEAAYQHAVGAAGELRWRIYYDQYRYTGRYDYASDDSPIDQRDGAKGDWAGTQLTYRFRAPWTGFFTVGSEASWDFRSLQFLYQSAPVYQNLLYINRPDRSYALFFQQEWNLSRHWKTYLGGRMDDSRNHPTSLTPRLALIYQPSAATAVKFLYGRSFRNPNSFEQFYDDSGSSQIPNSGLRAERMQTFEVAFERRLSSKLDLLANAYQYRLDDVITAVPITETAQQFRNVATGRTTGFELEASARLGSRIRANASLAVQRTDAATSEYLEVNSPTRVGKLRFEIPFFKDRWSLSSGLHYLSERETTAGSTVPAAYLVDLVLASRRLPAGLEIQCGAHNLLNYRYWDPAGLQLNTDRLLQDGRNIFHQLSWSSSRPKDEAQRSGPGQP